MKLIGGKIGGENQDDEAGQNLKKFFSVHWDILPSNRDRVQEKIRRGGVLLRTISDVLP
jgi:hypothetical protein